MSIQEGVNYLRRLYKLTGNPVIFNNCSLLNLLNNENEFKEINDMCKNLEEMLQDDSTTDKLLLSYADKYANNRFACKELALKYQLIQLLIINSTLDFTKNDIHRILNEKSIFYRLGTNQCKSLSNESIKVLLETDRLDDAREHRISPSPCAYNTYVGEIYELNYCVFVNSNNEHTLESVMDKNKLLVYGNNLLLTIELTIDTQVFKGFHSNSIYQFLVNCCNPNYRISVAIFNGVCALDFIDSNGEMIGYSHMLY